MQEVSEDTSWRNFWRDSNTAQVLVKDLQVEGIREDFSSNQYSYRNFLYIFLFQFDFNFKWLKGILFL